MLHYPPFHETREPSEVTHLLHQYGAAEVVYGHLHGAGLRGAYSGPLDGILYHQVSCDGLGFVLRRLETENE
jgi:predicted phosphohydrolase